MKTLINLYQQLNPLTKKVFVFALLNILVVKTLLILLSVISGEDIYVLLKTTTIAFIESKYDSWNPMMAAMEHLLSSSTELLFDKVFFVDKVKFQYPVTSLLFFLPINWLEPRLQYRFVKYVSVIFIIVTIFFINKIFIVTLQQQSVNNKLSKLDIIILNISLFCLSLTFYPVIKAFCLGQIQVWINSLFSICVFCWLKQKKNIAGLLVGIMCLIKPQYTIIIIWGILRKQWSFITNALIVLSGGWIISIITFGLANNLNYFRVLSVMSKHGESFYANQSFNGLLNRMLFNSNNINWDGNSFPPFNSFIYYGTLISSLIIISLALFYPLKQKYHQGNIIDFLIISLSTTIASPIAWEHHYGIILSIYSFMFAYLLCKKSNKSLLFLSISYLLTSNFLPWINKKTYNTPFNFLQSYLFFGGLIVLIYLYVIFKENNSHQNYSLSSKISTS